MKTVRRSVRPYVLVAQITVVSIITIVGLGAAAMLAGIKLPSPMSTTEATHDHDVTVERLRDVSSYTAASQHLASIIDIEEKAEHDPRALEGGR